VEASLSFANLSQGFCDLFFYSVAYKITHSCTGIFTCLIFVAGVLAYPASAGQKFRGLLVGIPAFFIFGTARLALMGVIAATVPDYISLFHRYIMVMVGVGIALFLWMWWIDETVRPKTGRSLPA
jgi:exosortase/archaeosortase family protein